MTVGRNESCPCGSGKKYKRCCLQKNDIIQLTAYKREQFYQNKHKLVDKIREFIVEQVPFSHYHQLKAQFRNRLCVQMEQGAEGQYFHFWLHFFHRFENGLRGVEWFYKEHGHRLLGEEKELAKRWTSLKPMVLQAVDKTDEAVIFEDAITKKTYPVSNHDENLPQFLPWLSTVALLEPFQEAYYFNGVRSYVGPDGLARARRTLSEWIEQSGQHYETVLVDYYPEMVGALLTEERREAKKQEDVSEYSLLYEVSDRPVVAEFFRNHPQFSVNQWTKDEMEFNWLGNRRTYVDNQLDGEVKLADVYGTISLKEERLEFKCFEEQKANEMKNVLNKLKTNLVFLDEAVIPLHSSGVQIQNTAVSIDHGTPRYSSLYAQNAIIDQLDKALPVFDGLTSRQMVEKGRIEEVETWLKQMEFNMYRTVWKQFGEVEVTADFNTARKELGLSPSPFVTGGSARKTEFQSMPDAKRQEIREEDIPFLEKLGFSSVIINHFYTEDIIRFYKERTSGRSETTIRKYTNSLHDLRELLDRKSVSGWEQCNASFWETLIFEDYFDLVENPTKTERNDFLSTLKMFFTWLDKTDGTSYFTEALTLFERTDEADKHLKVKA